MVNTEYPVPTDVDRILTAQEATAERVTELTAAVNGLGANVQWIIDNVQGIFQMFSSPAFLANMPNMLSGGIANGGQGNPGADDPGTGA